jgi:hypothetical protein
VDEAKRFMRFILPGAVFGILTVSMLLLMIQDKAVTFIKSLSEDGGFGAAVAALLGSGAAGYIFSAIHHQLVWSRLTRSWWSRIVHVKLVDKLIMSDKPQLVVRRLKNNGQLAPLSTMLDYQPAHALGVSLWYERLYREPIKSADHKIIALTDTAHSAGTATVAATAAVFLSLFIAWSVGYFSAFENVERLIGALILGLGTAALFAATYLRVGRITNMVVENLLLQAMSGAHDGQDTLPPTPLPATGPKADITIS